jgi:hypothetical protein
MPRDLQTNYISLSGMILAEAFIASALCLDPQPVDSGIVAVQTAGIDYYVTNPTSHQVSTYELKTEVKHTGNLFAEFEYVIKSTGQKRKSWLAYCEADFLLYNFPFTPYTPTYLCPFKQFQLWCRERFKTLRVVSQSIRKSEPTTATGLLAPLEALQRESWFESWVQVSGVWVKL